MTKIDITEHLEIDDHNMLEPLSLDQMPEHKFTVNVFGKNGKNLFNNDFICEIELPKFCLTQNLSGKHFDQKSGIGLILEHAPEVIKNILIASKEESLKMLIQMSVDDEIYSIMEFIDVKLMATNLGILTKGNINGDKESLIMCEFNFEEIIVDGEKLY